MYNEHLNYQWDFDKAKSNIRKHGIRFADAVAVFEDEMALTIPDQRFEEDRWITIGMDFLGRLLVVVYTWRVDEIRVISARKATPRERREYLAK
jgi:hypothetical protein